MAKKIAAWSPPDDFPSLKSAKMISIDVETHDDDLKKRGPGVRRGAYIVGVAVATDDGFRGYYPVAHDEGPNLNKRAVKRWLKTELGRECQVKIGANILYDVDFLQAWGVEVKGSWFDVEIAEPLINENIRGRYNLDAIGRKYAGEGKREDLLQIECDRRGFKGSPQNHMWKLSSAFVGEYAEQDVALPLQIFPRQKDILDSENLWELYLMEIGLLPLTLKMRTAGVKIDETQLNKTIRIMERRLSVARKSLRSIAKTSVEYWAAESIGQAFDRFDLKYPLTPKTKKPSFTRESLSRVDHPLAKKILECRKIDKFIGTFLKGQIRDQLISGRLHCLFNPLKSDEFGAVTGRYSSSHPNLQFMPMRDEELGPLCRSLFVPEKDHDWGKADHSQVEYRIFAHYATGRGADEFRQQYRDDPRIDFHQWCASLAEIPRQKAKTSNFSIIYGAGVAKIAVQLGMSIDDTRRFLTEYHEVIPFARETLRAVSNVAERRGYIRTILGRRRRFDKWEPIDGQLMKSEGGRLLFPSREAAFHYVNDKIRKSIEDKSTSPRPGVKRGETYKALNALIQGSAADLLKKGMLDAWRAGVFDDGALVPHLTVHDELDVSKPRTRRGDEAWKELIEAMKTAIKFKVPIVVDAAIGRNWGKTK